MLLNIFITLKTEKKSRMLSCFDNTITKKMQVIFLTWK